MYTLPRDYEFRASFDTCDLRMHTLHVNEVFWLCAGGCQCGCGGLEWWWWKLDVLASGGKYQGNWSRGYQVSNSAHHTHRLQKMHVGGGHSYHPPT